MGWVFAAVMACCWVHALLRGYSLSGQLRAARLDADRYRCLFDMCHERSHHQ